MRTNINKPDRSELQTIMSDFSGWSLCFGTAIPNSHTEPFSGWFLERSGNIYLMIEADKMSRTDKAKCLWHLANKFPKIARADYYRIDI